MLRYKVIVIYNDDRENKPFEFFDMMEAKRFCYTMAHRKDVMAVDMEHVPTQTWVVMDKTRVLGRELYLVN